MFHWTGFVSRMFHKMAATLTISLLHTGITFCRWVYVRLAPRKHSAVGTVGSGDWRAT